MKRLLLLFLFVSTAQAQPFVAGGLAASVGPSNARDDYKMSFDGMVGIVHAVGAVDLAGSIYFDQLREDSDPADPNDTNVQLYGATVDVRLMSGGEVRRYIAPSFGFVSVGGSGDAEQLFSNRPHPTLGVAAGIVFPPTGPVGLMMEVRLVRAFRSGPDVTWFPIRLGVTTGI